MPVHDWSRVDAGDFHALHIQWLSELCGALNQHVLPPDYSAYPECKTAGYEPDVLTLKLSDSTLDSDSDSIGGIAVATAPPKTSIISCVEEDYYATKANRISIRHKDGEIVAIIEIVSPGNKSSKVAFSTFVEKAAEFLCHRVHVLIIDLLPPGRRDPMGIHKAIWDEFREEPFELLPGKDRILASYDAGPPWVAYVEPIGVGDVLPSMPLFLKHGRYVQTPLEESYRAAWNKLARPLQHRLESSD